MPIGKQLNRGMDSLVKGMNVVPNAYSLKTGDYAHFVPEGDARQLMRDNWLDVGRNLNGTITVCSYKR